MPEPPAIGKRFRNHLAGCLTHLPVAGPGDRMATVTGDEANTATEALLIDHEDGLLRVRPEPDSRLLA